MRNFPYITVGRIIEEINKKFKKPFLTRPTYYALEKRLKFPKGKRTTGKIKWRVYSVAESRVITNKIMKEYNLI